jgi:hypothetical protein
MPGATVAKQIVFDSILIIVLGLVVAFIEREPQASTRTQAA